jgi:hypothetical protein
MTALFAAVLLGGAWTGFAEEGDPKVAAWIRKIGVMIQKGENDDAKKSADNMAKKYKGEVDDIMAMFEPPKAGGLGLAGEGIEKQIKSLAKSTTAIPEGSIDAGHQIAAIGLVVEGMAPPNDVGTKTRKDWLAWSKALSDEGKKFADAAKANKTAEVQAAADRINKTCAACHAVFK